jgi:transposase
MQASHLNEDTLGRALDTLYEAGLTALYSLMAATAATRWGLTPTFAHLDTTRFHVDGRYHSAAAPDEQVVHMTHGESREHRPDLNQGMLAWIVEHQAGSPLLMQPLRGKRRDGKGCGQVSSDHMAQCQTAYSPTSLVADRALSNAATLHKLAHTSLTWLPRVPATWPEAQEVFAQAPPATMAALPEGYRSAVVASSDGGGAQRWVLFHADHRQPQAQRTVERQWRQQSEQEVSAFKRRCRTACACEADAPQARTSFGAGLPTTFLHDRPVCPTPHSGKRGRPGPGAQPDQIVYHITGALASRLTDRQARIDQQSGCILATNELDEEP